MKNVLIIAPHIDDELIGCWSVFNNPENNVSVVWLYELTEERKKEGLFLNKAGLKASIGQLVFGEGLVLDTIEKIKPVEVYVPSRRDSHLDHKKANSLFRSWATHFYSVDMDGGAYLGEKESGQKWRALEDIYPSQSKLWKNNSKYYLFERITARDYDKYRSFDWEGANAIVLSQFYVKCICDLQQQRNIAPEDLMEFLLSRCPTGRVKVTFENEIWISGE